MYQLNELHNLIGKFNKQFNTNVHANIAVYTTDIKVTLNYHNNADSVLYFNCIQEAINNLHQTYDNWNN